MQPQVVFTVLDVLDNYTIAFRKNGLPLVYWSNFCRPFSIAISCI